MTGIDGQIRKLVQQIIETVHPLEIILFGSAARGEMTPNSDIDVLVVMPNGTHRRNTAQDLYEAIEGISIPFDIIVATPSDLVRHKDNPRLIYRTILKEGRQLYAA